MKTREDELRRELLIDWATLGEFWVLQTIK